MRNGGQKKVDGGYAAEVAGEDAGVLMDIFEAGKVQLDDTRWKVVGDFECHAK
jgi:hypothetical protein